MYDKLPIVLASAFRILENPLAYSGWAEDPAIRAHTPDDLANSSPYPSQTLPQTSWGRLAALPRHPCVYMHTHVLFYMPLIHVYFLFKRLRGPPVSCPCS